MSYVPNPDIAAAIKHRLSVLLMTDRPLTILAILIERKKQARPDLEDTVLEDLVMQDLILRFRDYKLDQLWHLYNVGYFYEDTETYLKKKLGDNYENFIDVLVDSFEPGRFGKKLRPA